MHRSCFAFALTALIALLGLSAPSTVSANGAYAYVDCSLQSNLCYGDGGSSQGPVRLMWSFDTSGTDAIFPQPCDNQNYCGFWCPQYPGQITAQLYVFDLNFNLLAVSAPVTAVCTQQDVLLP